MKKIITKAIVIALFLGCINPVISMATDTETNYQIEYFKTDFENSIEGQPAVDVAGHAKNPAAPGECVIRTENDNKYLDIETRIRTLLSESVYDGTICLEFDMDIGKGNAGIGVVYDATPTKYEKWMFGFKTTSGESGEILAYTDVKALPPAVLTGHTQTLTELDSSENFTFLSKTWQHYKMIIDIDNSTAQMIIDGVKSAVIENISFIGGENPAIGGIAFYTARGNSALDEFKVDNIVVYREENKTTSINLQSYEGDLITEVNNIPAMCEKAEISFTNPLLSELDLSLVSLYNETSGAYEEIFCEQEKRSILVYFKNGFLNPNSSYILTIPNTVEDKFGQLLKEAVAFDFSTDKGGFRMLDFNLYKNAQVVQQAAPGEMLDLHLDYARVGDVSEVNSILAVVYEKDGFLCNIDTQTVLLNQSGKASMTIPFEVLSTTQFDKLNVYLWHKNTRKPILSGISLSGVN